MTASSDPPCTDLRPSLTAVLRQRLAAFQEGFRHNLALLGPVGSGKSVLLHQLLCEAPARLITISCTLQRDSVPGFVRRFATAVLRGAVGAPADAPWDALLQQAAAVAPKAAAAAQQLERYATGHLQAEGFVHALDVVPIVHQELNRPCVLVLDEFLYLEELGLSHAFHEFGKRVMTWPFAMFWVSSSSDFLARAILRERLHLLFGQFELLGLGPIEPAAGMAWMSQRCPGGTLSTETMRFLLQWIGASPWYLSIILKRVNELARLKPAGRGRGTEHRRSPEHLEPIVCEALWDVLGSADGVLYQRCAAHVERMVQQRYGPLAREALVAIARGARTTQAVGQHCGTQRNLSAALQMLIEHDLVQRKGACWVIPDQALACWVTTAPSYGPVGRAGAALGSKEAEGPAAYHAFAGMLQAIWRPWHEVTRQPLADRVNQLFSQFRNETISLDHKTGRLPSFQVMTTRQPSREGETYLVADGEARRWCCLIQEGTLEEAAIAAFEQFCRTQSPKPSRKVVVAKAGLDLNAKLLAKEANMWVWEPEDVNLLFLLYGQPPLNRP